LFKLAALIQENLTQLQLSNTATMDYLQKENMEKKGAKTTTSIKKNITKQ